MRVSRAARICGNAAVAAVIAGLPACAPVAHPPQQPSPPPAPLTTVPPPPLPSVAPNPAFAPITGLVQGAITAHRLPGAVVQIGHAGDIVYRQAFGERKLPGEPGIDGTPAPAELMTADTIFDLASLSKSIATTVAVLQLYEQHRIGIDDPVETHLPEFNPTGDPERAGVTLRMLLTHSSGLGGDLSHQGPWGLTGADKAAGLHRAYTSTFEFPPGAGFHYSDINFILLGEMVERITGEPLDRYVHEQVFAPLGMTETRYLPATKACGPHRIQGNALVYDSAAPTGSDCPADGWSIDLLPRIAPTARDGDTPGINPHFGQLLRGTVHDPTARRMGGVAGSAGVFSTVTDLGRYAQALLDLLAGRPSDFPLAPATAQLMASPQQPGHDPTQLDAANNATQVAIANTPDRADPLLAPSYPAVPGQPLRSLGWDIDTLHSMPRGLVFPIGGIGHTGFTGVTLWIDPGSDTYVIVLANVIHQPGGPPIASLSGDIATVAARALHLYDS